ncbi:MAG: hypothetical protein DRN15_02825 [Thermoprotei archaeon]|nr:MAG: hypothetical protein DRN15_02825 [Thermoprotei archaeon]
MFAVEIDVKGIPVISTFPWRIGIVLSMAFPQVMKDSDFEKAVEYVVSDQFFDEIELHIVSRELWDKVKPKLDERGIEVYAALQPHILREGLNLNSLNEDERRRSLKRLKELIEEAHARELKVVAICSGKDPGPDNRAKALEALKESIKELCEFSKERGIHVLLETFDRDHDKKLLLGPLEEAASLMREVRKSYSNVGLLWDLSHAPLLNEKPDDLFKYQDVLEHIHLGCAKRVDERLLDTHPVFYTPGAINDVHAVKKLISVLKSMNYQGIITLEVKPEEHQTSLEIVNAAKGVVMHAYQLYLRETLS